MANIKFPFGKSAAVALSATGAQAITIENDYTVIDGVTTEATGNRTLNITVPSELAKGNPRLFVASKTNGTQTTIFGTGITAPTITGVAGKTFTQEFVYALGAFHPVGTAVQID
jgi:hypothetical protein